MDHGDDHKPDPSTPGLRPLRNASSVTHALAGLAVAALAWAVLLWLWLTT